jgi:hypothetical protein
MIFSIGSEYYTSLHYLSRLAIRFKILVILSRGAVVWGRTHPGKLREETLVENLVLNFEARCSICKMIFFRSNGSVRNCLSTSEINVPCPEGTLEP